MVVDKIYMMFAIFIFHVYNIPYINNIVKNFLEKNIAIHPLTEVRGFLAGRLCKLLTAKAGSFLA